jgi:hypothetical protein
MSAITGSLVGSIQAAETLRFGTEASLAQSVERKALNLVVVGSSPTGGDFPASVCYPPLLRLFCLGQTPP